MRHHLADTDASLQLEGVPVEEPVEAKGGVVCVRLPVEGYQEHVAYDRFDPIRDDVAGLGVVADGVDAPIGRLRAVPSPR